MARGEDAKRWLDIGGKVIWVSNHGGRQLESSVAPFDVLPEVRKAVWSALCGLVRSHLASGSAVKLPAGRLKSISLRAARPLSYRNATP